MKGVLNLFDCDAAVGVLGEADGVAVAVAVADPEASSTSGKGHVSVSDDEDEFKWISALQEH